VQNLSPRPFFFKGLRPSLACHGVGDWCGFGFAHLRLLSKLKWFPYFRCAKLLFFCRRGKCRRILSDKPIDADDIISAFDKIASGQNEPSGEAAQSVPSLARVESEYIQRVLADCEGNISQAAKLLGIHRRSLQRKLSKYPPSV